MTLHRLLQAGREVLQGQIQESDLDAWLLMEYVFGIDRNYYFLHMETEAEADKVQQYFRLLEKRKLHIPLQHLTGVQEFMGMEFFVNEHVLIPRQDTEILVEEAEKHLTENCRVLDLCTGSGCILLSLLRRNENIAGTGSDISAEALCVAGKNRAYHGIEAELIESDLFTAVAGTFDVIVSNPPYIPTGDTASLMEEVSRYEPMEALDGGADGLAFYREIICQAPGHLNAGGWLLVEIGHDQGMEVVQMMKAHGFEAVEVIRDLTGNDRVVKGVRSQGGKMFDKLEDLLIRFEELLEELGDPSVVNDQERFRKLMKEQNELQPIVDAYKEYKACKQNVEDSLGMLEDESDEEMREMVKEELSDSKKRIEELEHELKILLLPKDPNDDKNVIVEIRGGAGGDEAALFAAEIYRMYVHYAESNRWKVEMISLNENGIGGFKEVVFMITGQGAYSKLKYESGVHRVQRIPTTESGGRIHTSTITVAIMPEAEDVDVELDLNDCKFDVFRASGNGGQCVNTTDSAVRLTHIPTGIVVSCQDEKSQLKNKDKALKVLRSRLYEMELEKQTDAEAEARKSQVGTGDRSEKIRTYNFPQGRVTDHRIRLTLYKLDAIMNGDISELIDSLIAADQAAKLSNLQEAV